MTKKKTSEVSPNEKELSRSLSSTPQAYQSDIGDDLAGMIKANTLRGHSNVVLNSVPFPGGPGCTGCFLTHTQLPIWSFRPTVHAEQHGPRGPRGKAADGALPFTGRAALEDTSPRLNFWPKMSH